MGFKLMCLHVLSAVLVIDLAMSLHLISNEYYHSIMNNGEGNVNLAGIIVNGALIYDITLWSLISIQFIVIILILYLHWNKEVK